MRSGHSSKHAIRWLALPAALLILAASPAAQSAKDPDKLVILSVVDMKGKTSPCGCHIPKGGFSRQASFADSIREQYGQVLWVDGGGFFPETSGKEAVAVFMMQQMKALGFATSCVGPRDLSYGLSFLRENVKATGLSVISSNLYLKASGKPVFPTTLIKQVGTVKVGLFSVISDKAALGPSGDSLVVKDPTETAKAMVKELRAKGATVVVALSQLGKVESEDLVTAVDGVDAMVIGMNVPVLQKGRLVKNTVACYGGEQGQYMGRTILALDAKRARASGENETFILSPEVGENEPVLAVVRAFEAKENERQALLQKEKIAKEVVAAGEAGTTDHYLGAEVCSRCHISEYQQWERSPHAKAWESLTASKQETNNECVSCHVVGFQKAGGFQNATVTPKMSDVQCESCHGMGTKHDSFAATPAKVASEVCETCHTKDTSPSFSFDTYKLHVMHATAANLPPLPKNPAHAKMSGGAK